MSDPGSNPTFSLNPLDFRRFHCLRTAAGTERAPAGARSTNALEVTFAESLGLLFSERLGPAPNDP
jgi:hypothetical protein